MVGGEGCIGLSVNFPICSAVQSINLIVVCKLQGAAKNTQNEAEKMGNKTQVHLDISF